MFPPVSKIKQTKLKPSAELHWSNASQLYLQFSVINIVFKKWQWRIKGCNLYSNSEKKDTHITRITEYYFFFLLQKNCFRKWFSCFWMWNRIQHEKDNNTDGFWCQENLHKCQGWLIAWAERFAEQQKCLESSNGSWTSGWDHLLKSMS